MIFETTGQLSLRTVSIPFASNTGCCWSGDSYLYPTYRFLDINTHGWYTFSNCNFIMKLKMK